MTFDLSGELCPLLADRERDSEVARPGPEEGRVGERHVQQVTMTTQVRVPSGLEETKYVMSTVNV